MDKTLGPVRTATVTTAAFVVLTVLVAISWSPLVELDERIARANYAFGLAHPGWVEFLAVCTTVFGPWVWRVLVTAVAVWFLLRHDVRAAAMTWIPIVIGGAVEGALKAGIGRPRPMFEHPLAHASGGAFPSGHATTAAIGCAVLVLAVPGGPRSFLWTVAVVITGLTAYSRVGLGVHWTSDVVGGVLLGIAVVALTRVAFARLPQLSGQSRDR